MSFNIKNLFVLPALLLFVLVACTSPKQKLSDNIKEKENLLYKDSSMAPDEGKAKEIIQLYISYADKYPEDTLCASYLFKAGDLSSKINETHQAIELFSRLIKKYPSSHNAPYALFLQGFIYENQVGDPMKAKPYYETFLKTYPDHPIAGDVSFSMENLGKSPEELIREFESRVKEQGNGSSGDTLSNVTSR